MSRAHVVDFICAEIKLFEEHALNNWINFGETTDASPKYIGLDISYYSDLVDLSQRDYANSIKYITVSQQRNQSNTTSIILMKSIF